MVNYGTTVTKAVVTVVPVLLSQSFHSYGTGVTMPLERVRQQAWNDCDNRAISRRYYTTFDDNKPLISAMFAMFSEYLSACGNYNILINR